MGLDPWILPRLLSKLREKALGADELPAKSGKKTNSIEKETKEGRTGSLVLPAGVTWIATILRAWLRDANKALRRRNQRNILQDTDVPTMAVEERKQYEGKR